MHSAIIRHKILTIPGLNNSGPTHWQSLWEHKFPHSERVELGSWDNPDKNEWVRQIAAAIWRTHSFLSGLSQLPSSTRSLWGNLCSHRLCQ